MSDVNEEEEGSSVRSDTTECGICMDPPVERGQLDSCNHKFCYDCIKKWSEKSTECPHCRKNFKRIEPVGQVKKRRKKGGIVLKKKKKLKLSWNDYGLSEAWNQEEIDWTPSRGRRSSGRGGATAAAARGTGRPAPGYTGPRSGAGAGSGASLIDLVDLEDAASPPSVRGRGRGAAASRGGRALATGRTWGRQGQEASLIFVDDSQGGGDDYVELVSSGAAGSVVATGGSRRRVERSIAVLDEEGQEGDGADNGTGQGMGEDLPLLVPAARASGATSSSSLSSTAASSTGRAPRPGSKAYKELAMRQRAAEGAAALLADAQAAVDSERQAQAQAKAAARAQARREQEEDDEELEALFGGAAAALKRRAPSLSLSLRPGAAGGGGDSDSEEEDGTGGGASAAAPNGTGMRIGTAGALSASTLRGQMNALDPARAERGRLLAAQLRASAPVTSSSAPGPASASGRISAGPALSGRPLLPSTQPLPSASLDQRMQAMRAPPGGIRPYTASQANMAAVVPVGSSSAAANRPFPYGTNLPAQMARSALTRTELLSVARLQPGQAPLQVSANSRQAGQQTSSGFLASGAPRLFGPGMPK